MQLFYIGFAQAHCTKVQPLTKALLALTDSHSPSRVRVNNAVSNAEGFDEIWNCRKETETKKNESQETVGAKNQDGDLNEPGSSAEDMSREVCTMW